MLELSTRNRVAGVAFTVAVAALMAGCPPNGGDDEPRWETAFDATETGWLLSVSAHTPDDVWAVGGTPDEGTVMHYDGSSWKRADIPTDVPLVNWVHVFDDGTPYFACNDGIVMTLVDGQWEVTQTETDQDLWGIWGESTGEVWTVGGNGREEGQATVLRDDGDGWNEMTLPELERPNVFAFFKVWGTSADDVYIVGQRGGVLHWDGDALGEELVGTSRDLISLWGTGPDDVTLVGGRGNGVVAHWNGNRWHSEELAPHPGINGVWTDTSDHVWIAGVEGTLGKVDLETYEVETFEAPTSLELHGIFGLTGERIWSVGGTLDSPSGPFEGVALQRELGR